MMDQNPELSDEELLSIADEPTLKAKLTPTEMGRLSQLRAQGPDRGSGPVGRFMENAVQPLVQAPGMMATVGQSLLPTEGGAAARQELGRSIVDPSVERLGMAAQANREGRPLAAVGNAVAAVPVVGPAVAHGIDQMRAGDVAGGAGTLTGIAAPFAAGPIARGGVSALKGTAVGEGLANKLESGGIPLPGMSRGANAMLVDQIVPKVGPNKLRLGNKAADIAPKLLRDPGLSAFSRSGLAEKITARLDQATEGLDVAADGRLVSQQVQTGPLLKALDQSIADLTAQPVEASAVPRAANTPPAPTRAEQLGGITGELTDSQAFKSEPLGQAVEPSPNAAQIGTLRQIRREVAQLGPVAPYEAVRRIRASWDKVAKIKYNAATSPDFLAKTEEATGAYKGTGAMRESLAQTDPGSAQSYETYSLYKSANDVVQAAEEANRVRPNRGRGIMARTAGAVIGAHEGGVVGAGIGAIAAGIADRAAEMAPTFQIAIARRMAAAADAFRKGDAPAAQQILERAITKFPAVKSGLKISGKMTPAATVSGLPLAAGSDPSQHP